MTTYMYIETSDSLVLSYEALALNHKKNLELGRSGSYYTTFPLLILNASIVEGILRFWLSNAVKNEQKRRIKFGEKLGQKEKDKSEILLERFLIGIETNGGFNKLKEDYSFFFDLSLEKIDKSFDPEPLKALFTLRNILAHGTALVAPKISSATTNKNDYVDNWQTRLQQASTFMNRQFSTTDIFAALNNPAVPKYFLEYTQNYLKEVISATPNNKLKTGTAFEAFSKLNFGFRNRL